jgi:hypothetical protein
VCGAARSGDPRVRHLAQNSSSDPAMAAITMSSCEGVRFNDRRASLASSAGSTVSCKNTKYLYKKVPPKPDITDETKWGQFLLAYQRGDWEAIESCANQCSKKARKVLQEDGQWVDNRGK